MKVLWYMYCFKPITFGESYRKRKRFTALMTIFPFYVINHFRYVMDVIVFCVSTGAYVSLSGGV